MKLSFLPGELYLDSAEDGHFRVTLQGREILRTISQKAAMLKFNQVRKELEKRFPERQPTDEEKAQAFRRIIGDALVNHNSLGGRKKKTTAGSTRTFGG
jgi:hypothetical protein